MKLRSQEERDELVTEHVETIHFFDEATGELDAPEDLPEVDDPQGDEDAA